MRQARRYSWVFAFGLGFETGSSFTRCTLNSILTRSQTDSFGIDANSNRYGTIEMKKRLRIVSLAVVICSVFLGRVLHSQDLIRVGQELENRSRSFDGFECRYTQVLAHDDKNIEVGKTIVFGNGFAINYLGKTTANKLVDPNFLRSFEDFDRIGTDTIIVFARADKSGPNDACR